MSFWHFLSLHVIAESSEIIWSSANVLPDVGFPLQVRDLLRLEPADRAGSLRVLRALQGDGARVRVVQR